MKSAITTAAAMAATALAVAATQTAATQAAVIDFESVALTAGEANVGTVYTEDGLVLEGYSFSGSADPDPFDVPEPIIVESINGDKRGRINNFDRNLLLRSADNAPFTLNSFDISNFTFNQNHNHQVTLIYSFADGSPDQQVTLVTGVDFSADRSVETTISPNVSNLSSVFFVNGLTADQGNPDGSGPGEPGSARNFFIDDINATAVPEPASAAAIIGLGGLLLGRRRG
jgi:hypothetical protein